MGILDIFRKPLMEEDIAKFDEKRLSKNITGGALLITIIFPADVSEFPEHLISNIVKIIEKGYPFIKLVPAREEKGQEFTSRYDVQKGYSVMNDLFNVEIILKILDIIAKNIPDSTKIIVILKKGIYSETESLPNVPWVYSKSSKFGVVISTYPLEYKLSQHMNGYYDKNLLKKFAEEFQIPANLSSEDLYRVYWITTLIFHEIGHALGLPHTYESHDIMSRPTFVRDVFDRGYKMPGSEPQLIDNLKKFNLKKIEGVSPLLSK